MRRDLGILAGVAAAAVAIGLVLQTGRFGRADPEPPAPLAETAPAPQIAPTPTPAIEQASAPAPVASDPASDLSPEIARLEAALAEREGEYAALAAILAERDTALAARDAVLAERDAEFARLTAALAARDAEIRALRGDLAALRDRFAFDVQLAAAKAGVDPAVSLEAVRADAADLDAMLALAKPPAGGPPAADRPMTAIHFENGSAAITPGGRVHAAVAAVMLAEMPLERIRLIGFADTTGDPARNRRLAERRAEAVAAALVAAGLPAARIETSGVIEAAALPVATGAGVAEPLNRSVAIIAVPLPTT